MGREDMVDSMVSPLFIAVTVGVATLVLIATGWWRLAFAVFRIGSGRLTVRKLGLLVSAPADVERVNTLLRSFAGGFNAMISRPSSKAWRSYCDSLPVLFEPFANEGAAMGFTLRRLFRYSAATFEDQIARAQPGFRYLYYVGLGFWSGMRNHDPQRLARIVDGLDPMYRYLCYDGYGFKHAFFDPGKSPQGLGRLAVLEGYSRNAAYQGVGRAVFFMFMDRPDRMVEYMEGLGVHGADAAAGLGLAAVFVNPDRLEVARKLAVELPDRWRDHFPVRARSGPARIAGPRGGAGLRSRVRPHRAAGPVRTRGGRVPPLAFSGDAMDGGTRRISAGRAGLVGVVEPAASDGIRIRGGESEDDRS
jgi:hypothetical protein